MESRSSYTQEQANAICAKLAEGESLRSICRRGDMPSLQTVYNWMQQVPGFVEQYARAKGDSADFHADRIISLAEDVVGGRLDPNAARVAIDAIKWTASKLEPKKYGDKLYTENKTLLADWTAKTEAELADELAELGGNVVPIRDSG